MKRLLFLLLLLPFCAPAQQKVYFLTEDSLKKHGAIELVGKREWQFSLGDSAAMASADYDDSKWQLIDPVFVADPDFQKRYNSFSSVGWFRYHFVADSSVVNMPLSLSMQHFGASEVFLDGKKIAHWGKINGKDSTVYFNPMSHPATFVIPSAGKHVLAVRYANYDAARNFRLFRQSFSGFILTMGKTDNIVFNIIANFESTGFFTVLLFAIFITLFVLHLLLFLYYRSVKSNLYFSFFCLGLSIVSWITYVSALEKTPFVGNILGYTIMIVISLLIFSLSGFSNELFSRKKLRFKIITALCVLCLPAYFLFEDVIGWVYLGLSIFVLLEAIVLTISGIARKVKGARILGAGILFFAIFLIFIFVLGIVRQGLEFSGDSGEIFMYVAFCAILSLPASMSAYLSRYVASLNKDLTKHLRQVEELSAKAIEQEQEKKKILEEQNEMLEREVASRTAEVMKQKEEIEQQHTDLKKEKKKSDDLLLNILPAEVAEELKEKGSTKARLFEHVTVLFTDFVGFTTAGERMHPEELIGELDTCFKAFDTIISRYGIEKIKTIGDAYLAISGLPDPVPDHAEKVAQAALEIAEYMAERHKALGDRTFEIRIGMHSGSVVAGIVGVKKFAYDIWGDTVNTAARMQQHSEPGKINITQTSYELIRHKFNCTYRGKVEAKNKGELKMYFIDGAVS